MTELKSNPQRKISSSPKIRKSEIKGSSFQRFVRPTTTLTAFSSKGSVVRSKGSVVRRHSNFRKSGVTGQE